VYESNQRLKSCDLTELFPHLEFRLFNLRARHFARAIGSASDEDLNKLEDCVD